MTLQLAIARAGQQSPAKSAIRGDGYDRSWAETSDRVARMGAGLLAFGLAPGDRLAILALNGPDCLELTYAAVWAGIVVVPLNHRLSVPELAAIVADSGAAVLAHDAAQASGAAKLAGALNLRLLSLAPGGDLPRLQQQSAIPPSTPDPTGLFGLYYTGGTTGRPKGVELSHVAMHLTALDQLLGMEITAAHVFLVAPPLFHMAGFTTANSVTYQQGTHVFTDDLTSSGILAAIRRHGVNLLSVVPTVYRSLIDEAGVGNPALAQITNIVYGAAPASDGLLRDLLAAFPNTRLKQAYGQTEIAGACAILPPEVHQIGDPRLSCAGRATHSVQMRIIGPDGQELPRGSAGEIAVAGPRVMRGYWNLPDQTAQTIIDGWLRTGDVGIMDDQGYVRIVDRLKDMIVSGGENVFCGEVEAVLDRHPDVAAVAVVGVPDPLWGEAVHAFVVPVSAAPDPAHLIAHARRDLGGYKTPKGITFVTELPLSGVGKVRKGELRQLWLDENASRNFA